MSAGIIILVAYAVIAILLVTKKLPTFIALIIMGAVIALAAGTGFMGEVGLLTYIIPSGVSNMGATMIMVVLACWLGKLMEKTGVTYTIIKKAAEFGGDKPFVTSLLLCLVSAFLFTTMYGTGPVIMVGTIVIPLLLTCGLASIDVGVVFMLAYGTGIFLNPAWVGVYTAMTGAETSTTTVACFILAGTALVLMVAYLVLCFKKTGKKYAFAAPVEAAKEEDDGSKIILTGIRGLMACLVPAIVILGTFLFDLNTNTVFFFGIIWIMIFTVDIKKFSKYLDLITQCVHDGWVMAAPTAILMISIGVLLVAVNIPEVTTVLTPIVDAILPRSLVGLIAFVIILAPLAMYRGIWNPWGMGAALVALMCASPSFSTPVLTAYFMLGARWCNIHDPTSSQCIWSANYAGSDVTQVMKKAFIWDELFVIITALIVLPLMYNMFPM